MTDRSANTPTSCWCGDPRQTGHPSLCDRHAYAERVWATTSVANWKKDDES
jgi:hypothetical protein